MINHIYKFSNFLQENLIQTDLDLSDVIILDYIFNYSKYNPNDMDCIIENNIVYVYIPHNTFQEDLPFLRFTKQTWKNKLCKLKKNNWLLSLTRKSTNHGSMSYYALSEKCINLMNNTNKINHIISFTEVLQKVRHEVL